MWKRLWLGTGKLCCGCFTAGYAGRTLPAIRGNQPFTTYPRTPGHEFSAQIVTIPENDRGLKSGDIVTCNPYFNCGSCYACRKGLVNACTDNQTMGVQRDGAYLIKVLDAHPEVEFVQIQLNYADRKSVV